MSNNYWDEEDDDLDTESQTFGANESDLLKKLRKAKRADEKRIKELTEQLETISKVQREGIVKEVLEKKGVNQKAARLILKDLESNINADSVSEWLDNNADLFGIKIESPEATVDKTNLAALRQQDVVTEGGFTPDRSDELGMKIDNAQSADELLAYLRSQS